MTTNPMKILKNRSKTCGHSYGRLAHHVALAVPMH